MQKCAKAMAAHGVQCHDRVAGFLGNHSDTVVAMLAATSLGAVWTGVSADTGVALVVEKLSQIKPVLLFADNAVTSHGKVRTICRNTSLGSISSVSWSAAATLPFAVSNVKHYIIISYSINTNLAPYQVHESITKTIEIVKLLPTLKTVVIFETLKDLPIDTTKICPANGQTLTYADFLERYLDIQRPASLNFR